MQVNRSTIYKQNKTVEKKSKIEQDIELADKIRAIQVTTKYSYGARRMSKELARNGIIANHKRVARIMTEYRLHAHVRKKRNYKVSVPKVDKVAEAENLLDRQFDADEPGQKLVADVTYMSTKGGEWNYLSLVKDLATSEIVAWKLSRRQDLQLGFETLQQVKGKFDSPGLFHSDRGFMYTHPAFREKLNEMGFTQSLSRKACCLDNAVIESFNATIKCEWFYPRFGKGNWNLTFNELAGLVDEYVMFYNGKRIQKKLGYMTPLEYKELLLNKK